MGAFEKLSCVYYPYLSPGLEIIMKCFVCRVHYCYSRAGEVIHALISHQGESLVHWDLWFIQAFNRSLFCFFCHFSKMSSKENGLYGISISQKLIAACIEQAADRIKSKK